jgi:phosphoribosylamine-glycine ligase
MNTHADRSNLTPLGRVATWVGTKLRARRARRLEEETVACLSTMDSRLRNDIGVAIGKLDDLSSPADAFKPAQHSDGRRQS